MAFDSSYIIYNMVAPILNFLFAQFPRILAIPSREPNYYTELEGKWHEYHLTRGNKGLVWLCGGECNLDMKGHHIKGSHTLIHPEGQGLLNYKIVGEIRNGKLILTENCTKTPTEFFTVIYPNLLSNEILVGIWTGFDWEQKGISGPMILSRKKINKKDMQDSIKIKEIKNYLITEDEIAKLDIKSREPDWIK